MRKLAISMALIAFFVTPATTSALAQPDHEHGQGGGAQPQKHGGPSGAGHSEHGGGPRPQAAPNPALSRGATGGGNSGRATMTSNPGYSRSPNGAGTLRPQVAPNMAGRPAAGFNRPASGGQRHDFHGFVDFHQNFTAPRHFHAGGYRRPAGWYPHHWVFGEFLPAAFWARDYWLMDFMDFGLPPPPYGAVWVRVGNDALLIDQGTGEIITVEYGVFY